MFDAGRADGLHLDGIIKRTHCFETRIICKLLRSPDYIGRRCSKKDPIKYKKNKAIIRLIDKIRYRNCGSRHSCTDGNTSPNSDDTSSVFTHEEHLECNEHHSSASV